MTARAQHDLYLIREALDAAKLCRDSLRHAGARKAHAYVCKALKSIEGAERHAMRMLNEAKQADDIIGMTATIPARHALAGSEARP